MMRRGIPSLVIVGVLWASRPLPAADSPVEAIPDSAGAVIRLKSPQKTWSKVRKFLTKAVPKSAKQFAQMGRSIPRLIKNPTLAGLDLKRDWWIAVFPTAEGEPRTVYAAPAKDVSAMKTALGGNFKYVQHEDWLLYTEDQMTYQKLRSRALRRGKSISAVIDEKSSELLNGGDVGVFVNIDRFKEAYKTQLDVARSEIDAAMNKLADLTPEVEGLDLKPAFAMYGELLRDVLQAVDDTEGFAASVSVKSNGIEIEKYLNVAAGSPTDKFLQANVPSEMKTLAKLPPNKLMYIGVHGNMKGLMDWAAKFTLAMYKGDKETSKQIKESLGAWAKLEFGSYMMSLALGDSKEGVIRTVVVTEVKPAEKVRTVSRKLARTMAKVNFGGVRQELDLKEDAEKYGEHSADVTTVKQEFDEEADPQGLQKQIMATMYGPEGMITRTVYLPDMVVQTMGGGKATMTEVLAGLEDSESGTRKPAHQVARMKLLEKANLVALIDLPGLVADGLSLVLQGGELPIAIDVNALKKKKRRRSYVGFSLATEPQGVRTKTYIPIGQIQGFVELLGAFPVPNLQRQGQQPHL